MKWPLYIASRYLFSKKSHNAINLISLVSVLGIAAASLAMVCTLSAFNGFQELLGAMYRNLDPDLKITAVEGKSFHIDEERFSQIKALDNVAVFCESIEENVLVRYKDSQTSALMKGVSLNYDSLTNIDQCIRVGHFAPIEYDIQFACIGVGLASTLGTGSSFIDPVTLYAAKRKGKVNLLNPTNAFKAKRILISGSFGINQTEVDDAYLITPLDFSRELLEHRHSADVADSLDLRPVYDGVPSDKFNVTVSHMPQLWRKISALGYGDLVLSGHVHAMQMKGRIGSFEFSPSQLMYSEWSGHYEEQGSHLYITDGVGSVGFHLRIGAPPEITLLTLRRAD